MRTPHARPRRLPWGAACLTLALALGACQALHGEQGAPALRAQAAGELDLEGGGAAVDELKAKDAAPLNEAVAPAGAPAPNGSQQAPKLAPAEAGRELIRKGSLRLSVPVVADATASVQALAKGLGGYVGDMQWEAEEGGRPSAHLTVRVPARHFEALLTAVGSVGRLLHKELTTEDVTAEVVDQKARVRNLKAEEARLLELLKRTGKLSEVLEVERELARVRGEVEGIQSRLRELANLVGLATLEVHLTERLPQVGEAGWGLGEAWASAWREAGQDLGHRLKALIGQAIHLMVVEAPQLLISLLLAGLAGALAWAGALAALVRRGPRWPATRAAQVAWVVGVAALVAGQPWLLGLVLLVGLVSGTALLATWAWSRWTPAPSKAPGTEAP